MNYSDYSEVGEAVGRFETGVLPLLVGLYLGYLFLKWIIKRGRKNKNE